MNTKPVIAGIVSGMPPAETEVKLKRNIRLFGIYKIFTKRVFLPLTTIYATQQAGLTIQQIGLTTAAASLISVFSDSATGYWADTHGRKKSAQVGASLAALGSLIYVISTNFTGILLASLALAVGYSFLNGAMEALIHDTLVVLKQEANYTKVASRAMSVSLVANAGIIALVPLLYPIDKRLPFVAGFIAYCLLFSIASLLLEPKVEHDPRFIKLSFPDAVKKLVTRKTIAFFFCVGIAFAISTGPVDVFNLAFIKLGMQPKYLGIVFGITSLVGAALGIWIHHLKKLTFKQYATVDVMINLVPFIVYGIIRSLPLAIAIFIINFSFWRYESILYQHYVLEIYGTSRYKATVISLMSNFRSLHEIWIALVLTGMAKHFGLLNSIAYSIVFIVAFLPVFLLSVSQFITNARAEAASEDQ